MGADDWPPERIRALRLRLGLTQRQMAERMGYAGQSQWSRLEIGARRPTGQTVALLEMVAAQAEEQSR